MLVVVQVIKVNSFCDKTEGVQSELTNDKGISRVIIQFIYLMKCAEIVVPVQTLIFKWHYSCNKTIFVDE